LVISPATSPLIRVELFHSTLSRVLESALPQKVAGWGTWVLFGMLALGALMNLASSSRWERFLMSSIAAFLSLLYLIVALAG
jgi:hypothetical protein